MKPAITQIILGLLIAAACYFVQGYGVITSFTFPSLQESGSRALLEFEAETTTFVARWISIAGVVLGLAVFHLGIIQVRKIRASELEGLKTRAVAEITLGIAIVLSTWAVLSWGFSSIYTSTTTTSDGLRAMMLDAPDRYELVASVLSVMVFGLGLAVIGCGIGQYIKARKS